MDFTNVFSKVVNKNPIIGRALISQIQNWPTSPLNLNKNCQIFEQLNKPDLGIVEGLSEECYKILCVSAYTRKALIQRGLMNMQYYIMLDEAMRTQLEEDDIMSKGGRNQKGGIGLKQLLAKLALAFTLLGSSEGVDIGKVEVISERVVSGEANTASAMIFSAPVAFADTEKQLQQNRQIAAQQSINEMVEHKKPWVLPENSVIIAADITEGQADFFRRNIAGLNSRLASASRDATVMCGEIASAASRLDVFSNDAFVKDVLAIAGDLTSEYTQKSTSDIIQDKAAYATQGLVSVGAKMLYGAVTRTGAADRVVDSGIVMEESFNKVLSRVNQGKTDKTESILYSQRYQELCRATPRPNFEVSVDESAGGTKNLAVRTNFGNYNTGLLMMAHIETIEKIKLKLRDTDLKPSDKAELESLSERTQMEISLLESNMLFAPLDGNTVTPGIDMYAGFLADSTAATENFEGIVAQILEYLPLTGEASRNLIEIKRSAAKHKRANRQQAMDEWLVYISDTSKAGMNVLTENTENIVTATAESLHVMVDAVVEEGTGAAKTILTNAGDILGTAVNETGSLANNLLNKTGEVLDTGMDIAGNVVEKTVDMAANSLYRLLPYAISLLGVGGAAFWMLVWFKRNISIFSGNSSGNAQQMQQIQQLLQQQGQQMLLLQQQLAASEAARLEAARLAAAAPARRGINYGRYGQINMQRYLDQQRQGAIPDNEPYDPNNVYGGRRKTRKNKKKRTRKMKGRKRRQTKHRKNRQTKKR
jgi:hypothetical protein